MSNVKSKLSNRLLAALLSVVMTFSMLPITAVPAFAATVDHADWGVSVTVKDVNGEALPGATVTYQIGSVLNGADYETGTVTTDATGSAEILPKEKYTPDDLTLSASVSLADYIYADGSGAISNVAISSDDQDFTFEMQTAKITDVTVTATSVTYDGEDHPAATVSGSKDGDVIIYKLGENDEQSEMPTIKEPGTYSLLVKVQREGFEDFTQTVQPVVSKATIELNVAEYSGSYDKTEHPALTVTGLLGTDTVSYSLNGGEPSSEIPMIKNVGDYTVAVHVERHGYNDFDYTYSNIHIVTTTIEGLSASSYQGIYDGENHDAVNVSGTIEGDKVEYKLGDDGTWTEEVPQIKNAGNYTVFVRVTRSNYEVTNVDVIPATAYIAKADQSLSFNNFSGTGSTVELIGTVPFSEEYDFSAADNENLAGGTISYSIELSEEGDNSFEEEGDNSFEEVIAEIDAVTGLLKVYYPGTITVKATLTGNSNYNECTISYELKVTGATANNGQYIQFDDSRVSYILGANSGVASTQQAKKNNIMIRGTITYSMATTAGLKIDKSTGKITVTDYTALADAVRSADGTLTIEVEAEKAATRGYAADTATYILSISFADTPDSPYMLDGTEGTNGWYISQVVVSPVENYEIAKTDPEGFASTVSFDNQGTDVRYIYLKNVAEGEHNGEITDRIEINIKIDTVKPSTGNMKISYSESVIDKVLSAVTFGYYNPSVIVTFEASDETSGLSHLNWTYTRESGASTANLETETGELAFDTDGRAKLVLTGEDAKQYRGNLSFTSTDIAGNTSDMMTDTDHVIVVDTIAPNCEVSYTDPLRTVTSGEKQQRYFDGDVTLTITVTENNFYDEDFVLKVSKDGAEAKAVTPSWKNATEDNGEVIGNVFVGTYTLTGDGDYVVFAEYKDRAYNPEAESNNTIFGYESDTITIDTIDPKVSFSFDQSEQQTTFTVVEHNFRPVDITATVDAKDRNGNSVNANDLTAELRAAEWTQSGDTYTYTTTNYVDGIYSIMLDYKDLADRTGAFTGEEFIIDHDKPTAPVIEYSKSITDTVLGALTLGFYNPDVTVTFTSYDNYSGVDYFTWSYTRQDDAGGSSVPSAQLKATADSSDKSKFTASITLPLNKAEQLRGYIAATATDTYKNNSDKYTDSGKVIIVDTISPTMTVTYSEESNKVGSTLYYGSDKNGQVEVTLNVTEANFFSEDVVVRVSKNGAGADPVIPSWTNVNTNRHVGKFTISGDGHYVVMVDYTDRSNNKMDSYISDTITLDTIEPEIEVAYQNNNVINISADRDGNQREYFDKVQTAVVTITEHNFNADDVQFSIIGKDVSGTEQNIDSLITKSAWSTSGDVHKITLTYSGDANYTFDVDYTDLATNKADDYLPDYFTVDTVAPMVTSVTYSESVLETVLSIVSFGFYNAKMTVTVTATDDTAGVHKFDYSFLTAAGVSSVNAQLLDQAIEEGDITYSDGGRKATMSFEIPKLVLGNDNQFNGTVQFDVIDRSNNKVEQSETKRVVVDNISPTATVTYNAPVNSVDSVSYYDGSINGVITINEANFYSGDVVVMVSKNGGAAQVLPTAWTDPSVDVHTGSFTLTDDGDYVITVTYKDKSGNPMADYTSNQLTIDTGIVAPTIILKGLSAQGVTDAEIIGTEDDTIYAFKDAIVPYVSFSDQNYDDYDITLTQVQRISKRSWGKQDLSNYITVADKAGDGDISLFALDKAEAERKLDDGIYQLTVSMKDKATHSIESTVTFTVNRFGSAYKYSDALVSLITSGGAYATWEEGVFMIRSEDLQVGELTITEYNANRIVDGSLNIDITRDGRSVSDTQIDTPAGTGNGRENWFEYQYLISENNFTEDGTYRITISSEDEAKNTPESVPDNSIAENNDAIVDTILFRVDSTVPEITSITGLENRIINEQTVEVRYTVYDAIGLKSVTVYVNGTEVQTIDSFDDLNNYSGTFTINESSSEQTVRILVEDLAGNATDSDRFGETDADGNVIVPVPAYSFNRAVTVSTNFFVRWYADKPLFWGSIGVVVVLAGAIWFLVVFLRKKKKGDEK